MPEAGRPKGPLAGAGRGLADRLPDRGRAARGDRGPGGSEEWGVLVGGGVETTIRLIRMGTRQVLLGVHLVVDPVVHQLHLSSA